MGVIGVSPEEEKERYATHYVKNNIAFFAFDYPGIRKSAGQL